MFKVVHKGAQPGYGLGDLTGDIYDLADSSDRVFPFDYEHTGKKDHLCLYRPGHGVFYIMKRKVGPGNYDSFIAPFKSSIGMGSSDLKVTCSSFILKSQSSLTQNSVHQRYRFWLRLREDWSAGPHLHLQTWNRTIYHSAKQQW
jgi:hypothetical protein